VGAGPVPGRRSAAAVLAALAGGTGVVLRFVTTSALWLDEAQSVAIARVPLADIPGALRRDGAPPLYYVLLHGWIRLFGDGDVAVRVLSGICSVAAIVVLAVAVSRRVGRRAAVVVALVLATNPFAAPREPAPW
jgi:mannosyltransferase